jgi:hypothetical protein
MSKAMVSANVGRFQASIARGCSSHFPPCSHVIIKRERLSNASANTNVL